MPRLPVILLTALAALPACGDDDNPGHPDSCPSDAGAGQPDGGGGGDAGGLPDLAQLVDDYENGVITRDQFRAEIARFPDGPLPCELTGVIAETTLLTARAEPYFVTADLEVAAGAILVAEAGAVLELSADVNVNVNGRFYAVGSEAERVIIRNAPGVHYDSFYLNSGPNQVVFADVDGGRRNLYFAHPFETHSLVESCRFDFWTSIAIGQLESSNLYVYRSEFGYDTPPADISGEAIRTRSSGIIVVEESRFSLRHGYSDVIDLQDCVAGLWPVVVHNRFDGGEDDAVDLDGCSAFVIGNYIHDFKPRDPTVQTAGINGGGITGDQPTSKPFIANNVIDGCFHGIGYKDGAQPIIVNNTIINSNIGITLYQSAVGRPMPSGIAINNLLWNNVGWLDDAPNDIVLNGKWWREYNQVDDVQGTIDARYNLTGTLAAPYPGEGNRIGDPLLVLDGELPVPGPGSPARDNGLGQLDLAEVPLAEALDFLTTDHRGTPRARTGDTFTDIDIGAIEAD